MSVCLSVSLSVSKKICLNYLNVRILGKCCHLYFLLNSLPLPLLILLLFLLFKPPIVKLWGEFQTTVWRQDLSVTNEEAHRVATIFAGEHVETSRVSNCHIQGYNQKYFLKGIDFHSCSFYKAYLASFPFSFPLDANLRKGGGQVDPNKELMLLFFFQCFFCINWHGYLFMNLYTTNWSVNHMT